MTVEETIKDLLLTNKYLYNRLDAINYLFVVTGNEYKWINGELVRDREKQSKVSVLDKYFDKYVSRDMLLNSSINNCISALYEDVKLLVSLEERSHSFGLNGFDIDSLDMLTENSKIFSYPDNIKDDWRALIQLFIDNINKNIDEISDKEQKLIYELIEEFNFIDAKDYLKNKVYSLNKKYPDSKFSYTYNELADIHSINIEISTKDKSEFYEDEKTIQLDFIDKYPFVLFSFIDIGDVLSDLFD